MRRIILKMLRNTSITVLILVSAGLIAVSPAGLNLFSRAHGVDWVKLSSIGQTYGAVSALISGIALTGVVISLMLQSRALNLAREQAFRTYHFDLLRFAIENPFFISSWGYIPDEESSLEDVRKAGYTNMIVSFWSTGYVTGWLDEREVRFARTAEDEYRRAVDAGPPLVSELSWADLVAEKDNKPDRSLTKQKASLAVIFAAGFLVAKALRCRRNSAR